MSDTAAFSDRFVEAYSTETGEKYRIPKAWLDHPTLGKGFRKTPKARAAANQPAVTDSAPELRPETDQA